MNQDAGLPRASGAAALSATLRHAPEDFVVEELDAFAASGSGEHLLLTVDKRGLNTAFVAKCIAKWAGVPESSVGYAGLKDRHARARQRFSVQLPGREAPSTDSLAFEDGEKGEALVVVHVDRHARKLSRGALLGNRFALTLRDVAGDSAGIEAALSRIAADGVPNYFGEQRFGQAGDNVAQALAMFGGRRVGREQRSLLLSAARSQLFNRVLAQRVAQGSWNQALDGEVWMLDGSRSTFGPEPWSTALAERLARFDIHPSAPLWGEGGLRSAGECRALEEAASSDESSLMLRRGLESARLRQERRPTRLRAGSLAWEWLAPERLHVSFTLPPGTYATSVLAELGDVRDIRRAHGGRPSE